MSVIRKGTILFYGQGKKLCHDASEAPDVGSGVVFLLLEYFWGLVEKGSDILYNDVGAESTVRRNSKIAQLNCIFLSF